MHLLSERNDESGGRHDNYGVAFTAQRASRRGGQLLTRALGSSCGSACPHLRAPGASVPDGRTIHRDPGNRSRTSAPRSSYRLAMPSKRSIQNYAAPCGPGVTSQPMTPRPNYCICVSIAPRPKGTTTARMVRGEDPIRHHVQRAFRQRMMVHPPQTQNFRHSQIERSIVLERESERSCWFTAGWPKPTDIQAANEESGSELPRKLDTIFGDWT